MSPGSRAPANAAAFPPMSDPAYSAVFLSYASQDAEVAKKICDALRSVGVEVWFDQNELVGGDQWDQKIRGQVKACALFVPLISAATQARLEGYFRLEWKLAAQRTHTMADAKPFLLPVVIDATRDADAHVPEEFRAVQWTRLPGGETSEKFCERVKKLLAGETRPVDAAQVLAGRFAHRPDRALYRKPGPWLALACCLALVGYRLLKESPKDVSTAPVTGPASTAPSTEARQLVAKVWDLLNQPGRWRTELDTADLLCKRAASLDPSDAEVWAAWAQTDVTYVWNLIDASAARRDATRDHTARAMQLAPHSYEARLARAAYLAHGRSALESRPDSPEAEPLLRELLRERPGEPRAALELFVLVRTEEAFTLLENVAKDYPAFAARALNELAWRLFFANRYAEADAMADRSIAANPNGGNLGLKTILAYGWHGDLERAKATLRRMSTSELQEDWGAFLGFRVSAWRNEFANGLAALSADPREWFATGLFNGPKAMLTAELNRRAGHAELARRDYQRALTQLDARLVDEPNATGFLAKKAEVLFYLDRRPEADACYRLLRETGTPPPLNLQILFEPPEVALDALEGGVFGLTKNSAMLTAASLRLDPQYAPLRSHPRFAALLAQAEADPKRSPNAKPPKSDAQAAVQPAPDAKSVAVLAFANLSDDKDNEYFSDGISEELLNVLGRVPGLRVAAPMSAFSFKGKNVSAQEIGQKLNVAYLVNGSVRRAGSAIRVVARLSRADTDEQIWTEKFDGEAKNVFALQDEIAGKIAAALSLKLGASARAAKPIDPEAYRLYLEGRHLWSMRNLDALDGAEVALKRALRIEPESALIHAGLAELYATRALYRAMAVLPEAGDLSRAAEMADRAIALDPKLSQGYVARATIALARKDYAGAERLLRDSLALAPNDALALNRLGDAMINAGRLDTALEYYQRALQLDPLSVFMVRDVVRELTYAHRFREAIEVQQRFEAAAPQDAPLLVNHFYAQIQLGMLERATAELKARLPTFAPESFPGPGIVEWVFHLREAKLEAESEALAKQLLSHYGPDTYIHALVLMARGRTEEALPLLKPFPPGSQDRLYWSPMFDPVREDPRFLRKVEELGVAAEYKVARETLARMIKEQAAKK